MCVGDVRYEFVDWSHVEFVDWSHVEFVDWSHVEFVDWSHVEFVDWSHVSQKGIMFNDEGWKGSSFLVSNFLL